MDEKRRQSLSIRKGPGVAKDSKTGLEVRMDGLLEDETVVNLCEMPEYKRREDRGADGVPTCHVVTGTVRVCSFVASIRGS